MGGARSLYPRPRDTDLKSTPSKSVAILDHVRPIPRSHVHGRSGATRRAILKAALECFVDKGFTETRKCSIVLAFGMPGRADLDGLSAHEASLGLMAAQLLTNTPILQVFVHETESGDPQELRSIAQRRSAKHAINAYWMLYGPEPLRERAGQGIRQGSADAGPW